MAKRGRPKKKKITFVDRLKIYAEKIRKIFRI